MATAQMMYEEKQSSLVWLLRLPVLMILGTIFLLVLLALLVGAFRANYADTISPGVTVFGVDLGGLSYDQAIATLDDRFTYDDSTVITFRDGDDAWQFTAAELGLSFDVNATVDAAFAVGRAGNLTGDLLDQASAWFNGQAVAPIIHYDQNMAVARLTALAQEINRPPQNATATRTAEGIVTTPAQAGRTLDVSTTLTQLDNIMLTLAGGGEVPLIINQIPAATLDVTDAADRMQVALSGPLQLVAPGPNGEVIGPWTISTEQIAALLDVREEQNPDGTVQYITQIDMSGFRQALEDLAPGLRTLPQEGRFNFEEATGRLIATRPPVPGRQLDIDTTLRLLEQAVFQPDNRTIRMAFTLTQPRYPEGVSGEALGITELVGEATTYFTGSEANRRHNIAEGASRFDGIIIAPEEEFSFNQHLGDISYESGFRDGKVIVGGSTVNGIGGGICQGSTTAFRAALFGGYWISERNTHAYRVGYYELGGAPPGLDAAIWSPERDFKFINDTPHHVLIEVSVYPAQDALQFRLYSTDFGRQVEIQEPVVRNEIAAPPPRFITNQDLQPGQSIQVDYSADGMDVTIVRLVTDPDGDTRTDRVFTHYLPWEAVYEVAPGDPRLTQSGG